MTRRQELEELAAQTGATVEHDVEGCISRVTLYGITYGDGCPRSLLSFAEAARHAAYLDSLFAAMKPRVYEH